MSEASAAPAAPVAANTSAQNATPGKPAAPSPQSRDDAGRYAKGEAPAPKTPDEDPEFDLGDRKMKRSALMSELGRARNASKILTEAQQRAAKAEALEKAHQERTSNLKGGGPKALVKHLSELGYSTDEIREQLSGVLYSEFIEPEQLTAEQRRIRDLEARLSEREAAEKSAAEKQRLADEEKSTAEAAASLEAEFSEAIKSGGLPPTKAAVRAVAAELARFEDRGISLSLDEAVRRVRERVGQDTGEYVASASLDELRALWGDKATSALLNKVLAWANAQVRSPTGPAARPQPRPVAQTGERKRLTPQQFDDLMRKVR
jgi:hypothetical protein